MNDKEPFDRVVAAHGATVARVCRAVLGPHPDADDAWSETFLAALKAWPDLPVDANVEAWLVTIAHRKAIDVTRRRGRHAIPVAELPEPEPGSPSAETETGVDGRELWAAVADLPDKQRTVIAYRFVADLPYAEVAEIVGGTPEAARRAASDGFKRLRERLETDDLAEGGIR